MARATWAEIDLDAVAHNVGVLHKAAGGSALCAVVKADAYGHGAVPVAQTAVESGVDMLGLALVEEGAVLREAGIDAPILLLSEPPLDSFDEVVARSMRPTLYSRAGVDAAVAAVRRAAASSRVPSSGERPLPVHLKVDTGMHRVGASAAGALDLAAAIAAAPELVLEGVFTHCAVADDPADAFTEVQLARFDEVLSSLAAKGIEPRLRHAANSAVTFCHPAGRYDMVRCGISLYGLPPAPSLARCPGIAELRPALRLRAEVAFTKRVPAGEGISYGLRYRTQKETTIATVSIGYADGVVRRLGATGAEVLIRGRRHPIAGTVTMDQITVDCGDNPVEPGDEVVLVGRQGSEEITVDEWAVSLDTISYEIVCGLGARVPRRYLRAESEKGPTG